jgi:hypothetical protein
VTLGSFSNSASQRGSPSDKDRVQLSVEGFSRPLTLSAVGALKDSSALEIEASGYSSEDEARVEGGRLKDAMLIGGVLGNQAVDFRTDDALEINQTVALAFRVRGSEARFSVESPPITSGM